MKNKKEEKIYKEETKEALKAINIILKDIQKNAISKYHRHAEIDIDCGECKFRILEGYLEWYKDLLGWSLKEN